MSTPDIHPPNPFDAQDAAGVATVCAWCPELHILKLPRRDTDVIVVMQMGKGVTDVQIQRNGERLTISHGMCDPCKAAQLATVGGAAASAPVETVSREGSAPVPAEDAAKTGAGQSKEIEQTPAPAAPDCDQPPLLSAHPNLDDLRLRVSRLNDLLADAHPGLATWRVAYHNRATQVLEFFGVRQ
jgi:hypothetical protein